MKSLDDLENDANFVWGGTVDDNAWLVVVTRTGDYKGVMTVYRQSDDHVVHTIDVSLSYNAVFGPDVADVSEWQTLAIEAIDRFERGALPS